MSFSPEDGKVPVFDNSTEDSSRSRSKSADLWRINFIETDPMFDFQLHFSKFHRAQNILKPHIHKNSAEIVYMLHGMQYYTVEGQDYRILGGQLLISPPGLVHFSSREPEQKGEFYYLTINPDCIASLLPGDPETAGVLYELLTGKVVVRAIPDTEQLHLLTEELHQAKNSIGPCQKCRILCAILRLLIFTWDTVEPDAVGHYSDFMGQIYLYIEDHIMEKLRVDDIARVVQYSKTALQQKFKTYSHLTVHEYILSRKIEAAKRFMNEPDAKPYEVWKKLSFSSQSYFGQVFRRYTGMTISQFLFRRGE